MAFDWINVPDLPISAEGEFKLAFPDEFRLSLKYFSFPAKYRSISNFHDFFEIFYVYSGEGMYDIKGKTYKIQKGDVLLVSASAPHFLETAAKELKIVCLTFMPEVFYNAAAFDIDFPFLLPFYYDGSKINHLLKSKEETAKKIIASFLKIKDSFSSKSRFNKQLQKTELANVLNLLLHYYEPQLQDIDRIVQHDQQAHRLKDVFDFIHQNYMNPIRLEDLSAKANISDVYLCKLFKRVCGTTITDYILNYRINTAKKLLHSSQMNVSEIAYAVGFSSPSYFNRIFLRITKFSPLQYRSNLKG